MTQLTKYLKSPQTNNLATYTDSELRKLENVISTQAALIATLMESDDMATEIGTFVPVIIGLTTPGVGTYTRQLGRYWKRDRLALISLRVTTTAHTGTGNVRITGLPFPTNPTDDPDLYYVTPVWATGIAGDHGLVKTSSIDIYTDSPAGGVNVINGMDIILSCLYLTA